MAEERNVIPNFRFVLWVNGGFEVPLKSVRAFTRENEYDYIQEGGQNDFVYLKRKPISKPYTLQVERYVPTDLSDPLSNGTELVLPLILSVGKNNGGEYFYARHYIFTGAVIMSKEYGQLDAEHPGLLTETSTIGYLRMFCITNPVDAPGLPAWRFNVGTEDSGAEGNIEQLYSKNGKTILQNMMKQDSFEKLGNATMWGFKKKEKNGNGKANRVTPPVEEQDKAKMMEKRRKYNFALENNKNATGDRSASVKSAQNAKYSDKTLGEEFGIKELNHIEMAELARKWEFSEDKLKSGNGKQSGRMNIPEQELEKTAMREKASKWEFDAKTKNGKGKQNAQNALVTEKTAGPDGSLAGLGLRELSKEEMAAAASLMEFGKVTEPEKDAFIANTKKWEFDQKNKEGKGPRSRQNAAEGEGDSETTGIGVTEKTAEEFATAARKWEFKDAYTKNGTGKSSRKKPLKEEDSIDTMAGNATKYEFGGEGVATKDRQDESASEFEERAVKWEFKDKNSKAGNGKKSSTQSPVEEKTRDDMEKSTARKKWEFEESKKEGNGKGSRQKPPTKEGTKDSLISAGDHKKWEFTDDKLKAGNGSGSRVEPPKEETDKATMIDKSNNKRKVTQKSPKPNPKKWEFTDPNSKDGNGQGSRIPPVKPEESKEAMANKAKQHVKQTIADFLMK